MQMVKVLDESGALRAAERRFEAGMRRAADGLVDAAEALAEIRRLLPHGRWLAWCRDHHLPPRDGQKLLSLARLPEANRQVLRKLSLSPEVVYELAAAPPPSARALVDSISAGDLPPTRAAVREARREWRQPLPARPPILDREPPSPDDFPGGGAGGAAFAGARTFDAHERMRDLEHRRILVNRLFLVAGDLAARDDPVGDAGLLGRWQASDAIGRYLIAVGQALLDLERAPKARRGAHLEVSTIGAQPPDVQEVPTG